MLHFDREIELELNRVLWPLRSRPIPAWRAPDRARVAKRLAGGTGAALGAKLVTGFVMVAFAAAGATAASEAALTRSLNPVDWGRQVKQQVTSCEQGIGQCVSSLSPQSVHSSAQREATPARVSSGRNDDGRNKGGTHESGPGGWPGGDGRGHGNGGPGRPSDHGSGWPSPGWPSPAGRSGHGH